MTERDYYEILSVERTADEGEIKASYRKLAMKYHPDRNPGDATAEEKFKEATEAYEVLKDPEKRQRYDQFGHAAFNGQGGGGFGGFSGGGFAGFDINEALRAFMRDFGGGGGGGGFEDFFGGGAGRARSNRGEDLRVRISLTLEEIATGVTKKLKVNRLGICQSCDGSGAAAGSAAETCRQCGGAGQVRTVTRTFIGSIQQVRTCPQCQGSGKTISHPCAECGGEGRAKVAAETEVEIPAGVSEGNYLTVEGQGNGGPHGGATGDLQVVIQEKEHDHFVRQGDDVIYQQMISFATAALGGKLEAPTLRGSQTIKIPSGTQTGKTIKLRGEGIPHLRHYGRGDQIVILTVWTPTKLSGEDKKLVEAMERCEAFQPPKHDKSFLQKLRESLGV